MNNTELKPCPMCGGKAKPHQDYSGFHLVQCSNCGVGTLHRGYKEIAVKDWNRRVSHEKNIEKLIERLEEYKHSHLIEHNSEQCLHCQEKGDCGLTDCGLCVMDKAISIANQFAEEYKRIEFATDTNVASNGWISVNEKLPEDCTIYEVTAQFGNGMCYTEFAYYDESKGEWWKHDDDGLVNVIAWREHTPYQPKGE